MILPYNKTMKGAQNIKQIVAYNLKRIRKERGLTQAELAELADISNTYIANIECGRTWISDKTLERFTAALAIEPQELFALENNTSQNTINEKRKSIFSAMLKRKKSNLEKDLKKLVDGYFDDTFSAMMNIQK